MAPKRRMKKAYQGTAKRHSVRLHEKMKGKDGPSTPAEPLTLSESDHENTTPSPVNTGIPEPVETQVEEENLVDEADVDPNASEKGEKMEERAEPESESDSEEAEDSLRFRKRSAELKYENSYSRRAVLCERGIKLEDYADPPYELTTLFEERGWVDWVTAKRIAIVPLVREFYSNGKVWREEGKLLISTKVRGIEIEVNVDTIAEFGSLPPGGPLNRPSWQRQLWKEQLSKENLGKLLSGKDQVNWKRAMLPKGELTSKCNVLHMLVCSSMIPQAFRSSVSIKQAALIGRMLLNIPFNLANHIWYTIAWEVDNPENNSGLPFGGLITDIILKAGVKEEVGMERVRAMSLIATTSVKRSRGQLGKSNAAATPENVQQTEAREESASTSKTLEERLTEVQKDQELLKKEMKELREEVKELKAGQQRVIEMLEGIYEAARSVPVED